MLGPDCCPSGTVRHLPEWRHPRLGALATPGIPSSTRRLGWTFRKNAMAPHPFLSCIDACNDCTTACNECTAACLHEGDVRMMARCIALDMDCAQACHTAASAMARGSELAAAFCALCTEVCRTCGEECSAHAREHCRRCAEACRRCAEECRRVALGSGPAARQPV